MDGTTSGTSHADLVVGHFDTTLGHVPWALPGQFLSGVAAHRVLLEGPTPGCEGDIGVCARTAHWHLHERQDPGFHSRKSAVASYSFHLSVVLMSCTSDWKWFGEDLTGGQVTAEYSAQIIPAPSSSVSPAEGFFSVDVSSFQTCRIKSAFHMEALLVVYLSSRRKQPTIMHSNRSGLFIGFYQAVDFPVGLRAMLNMQVAKWEYFRQNNLFDRLVDLKDVFTTDLPTAKRAGQHSALVPKHQRGSGTLLNRHVLSGQSQLEIIPASTLQLLCFPMCAVLQINAKYAVCPLKTCSGACFKSISQSRTKQTGQVLVHLYSNPEAVCLRCEKQTCRSMCI